MRVLRRRALAASLAAAAALAGCGGGEEAAAPREAAAPAADTALVDRSTPPPYVNDLARDPSDGALLLTTNKGFFRIADGRAEQRAGTLEVGRATTTIGLFLDVGVVGGGTYLASGHPDDPSLGEYVGIIRTDDAGATWQPVSRFGETDVHEFVLKHDRVYGWDAVRSELIVSRDLGRTWEGDATPRGFVLDFDVDEEDPDRIALSTEDAVFRSEDGGRRWRRGVAARGARLAWPAADRLLRADEDRAVHVSEDGGRRWEQVGEVPGVPADFEAVSRDELLLALVDGSVVRTADGGRTWTSVFRAG